MKSHYSIASGCILLMFVSIGILILNVKQYNKAESQLAIAKKVKPKLAWHERYDLEEVVSWKFDVLMSYTDVYPIMGVMFDSAMTDSVLTNGEATGLYHKLSELENKSSKKEYFKRKGKK